MTSIERRPATASQASLFFAAEKPEGGPAYNLALRLDVRGPVSDAALCAAVRRVYATTAALRLRIGLEPITGALVYWFADGHPTMEVARRDGPPQDLIDTAAAEPFDVDEGPLTRALVVRTGPQTATVALILHHLTTDGQSYVALARRLARAVTGEPTGPGDSQSYIDTVAWIRSAERESFTADRPHWLARTAVELRPSWPRQGTDPLSAGTGRCLVRLDRARVDQLGERAARSGVSMFKLLVAAAHVALPTGGATHTVVGVATSQRPRGGDGAEVHGCFVNEVPMVAARGAADIPEDILDREGAGWSADLRRRNFPYVELAAAAPVATLGAMVAYRTAPRRLQRLAGDVTCAADLDFWYPRCMTDVSVRYFQHDGDAECQVQWGQYMSDADGVGFAGRLAAALGGTVDAVPALERGVRS